MILTIDMLKELFPKAKEMTKLHKAMVKMFPKYNIDSEARIAMFLAQCGHESSGFSVRTENLNYSAKQLDIVFGKYFKRAGRDAREYARRPEKIANIVYANRMDNGDSASGDGWKFRGRGYIQLTGRYNYTKFAKAVEMSIDEAIEYLGTVEGALESACWYWSTNNLNAYADKHDVVGATKRINGGDNGLSDRQRHYHHAMNVLGGKAVIKNDVVLNIGSRGEEVKAIQKALGIEADGVFGPNTKRAVKSFQLKNGLTPDGVAGPQTLKKLLG